MKNCRSYEIRTDNADGGLPVASTGETLDCTRAPKPYALVKEDRLVKVLINSEKPLVEREARP